ncbi:hypothetical protein [Clostridium cellulovorans]|uniref:Ribose 5-phosphate isomerase n=1 Tax=Clostridium cellulovorans (strain ATCC 35296 / DSM 3052 / OCM 3 / 743B) TaxID=573061 RepID=D9STN9_CLOC7|nr:hypothetical protein [Clostridium cellulovorans]ADL52773.1 hypothetical protein Clocel_3083 [Clostridium cellulovorans 743B]
MWIKSPNEVRILDKKRYYKIIKAICDENNIQTEELIHILQNKNFKYIFLLILKNNNCIEYDELQKLFNLKTKKSINYGCKKAKESLLINKEFRNLYYEYEKNIYEKIQE